MNRNLIETITGFLVLIIAAIFVFFVYHETQDSASKGYQIFAHFTKVDGVNVGSDVRLAGVKIGSVTDKFLDPKSFDAVLYLTIDEKFHLPIDSVLRITSDGIFGNSYISIDPGQKASFVAAGQELLNTQAGINFIDLVSQAIFKAAENNQQEKSK